MTPFVAPGALTLFGPSLTGLRLLADLVVGIAMVLMGLMARGFGGKRAAQVVAACSAVAEPRLDHISKPTGF